MSDQLDNSQKGKLNPRSKTKALLLKEWKYEWKHFQSIASVLLFVISIVFLLYLYSGSFQSTHWCMYYWLTSMFLMLFLGKNSIEEDLLRNRLYLFQLISPLRYLVAKILFLSFVYFILQLVIFFIFQLLIPMNSLLSWHWLWICLLTALGMCSISVVGSFFSYLASQNGHLQMILSLPLCFPIVGLAYAATLVLADGGAWSKMFTLGSMLMAVDLFNFAMILFVVSLMRKHG